MRENKAVRELINSYLKKTIPLSSPSKEVTNEVFKV